MTDRPIIFSAPMVRALLDGRKTQTRPVLKLPKWAREIDDVDGLRVDLIARSTGCVATWYAPYATGDRLWVRECWRSASAYDDLSPSQMGGEEPIRYEADQTWQTWGWGRPHSTGRHRAARHMPRWASRLTLIVTDVRVQRLCEISVEDAVAEGIDVESDDRHKADFERAEHAKAVGGSVGCGPEVFPFKRLWNSIHGPDAWDANPWVAAISFTVHRCNIDTMEEGTW